LDYVDSNLENLHFKDSKFTGLVDFGLAIFSNQQKNELNMFSTNSLIKQLMGVLGDDKVLNLLNVVLNEESYSDEEIGLILQNLVGQKEMFVQTTPSTSLLKRVIDSLSKRIINFVLGIIRRSRCVK